MCLERSDELGQPARIGFGVVVEQHDIVAGRRGDAGVTGSHEAGVARHFDDVYLGVLGLEEGNRIIGRAVVDDTDTNICKPFLLKQGGDAEFQMAATIVIGHDDIDHACPSWVLRTNASTASCQGRKTIPFAAPT